MESLKLINRERLFYNKYKYRVEVKVFGAYLLWFAKHKEIVEDDISSYRQGFERIQIIDNLPLLNTLNKWVNKYRSKKVMTMRIEGIKISFYSNDLQLLKELENLENFNVNKVYSEANVDPIQGIKYFVNKPKHNYRVYLKNKIVKDIEIDDLQNTFNVNKELYPNKSFKNWLNKDQKTWRKRYISSSFSIDYDDESIYTYLALMHSDILGHRYKLEKRPEQS